MISDFNRSDMCFVVGGAVPYENSALKNTIALVSCIGDVASYGVAMMYFMRNIVQAQANAQANGAGRNTAGLWGAVGGGLYGLSQCLDRYISWPSEGGCVDCCNGGK